MANGRVFETIAVESAPQEDDVEAAYQNWRSGLEDSETPGMVRAFRVPLDEQGKPSYSATGQVRLGTWPIDQYDFDSLCTKIMKEYMLPTESMMAVRLIGTITGKGGLRFNKIVTLQRPNNPQPLLPSPTGSGAISDIMRQMQESNERMMRMFQEMGAKQGGSDGPQEMMRTVAMMRVMMEPMMGMMGPMLTALAGRPIPAPGPQSSMKEMMETMMLMDRFLGRRGGGGNGGGHEPEWLKMVTAVSGVAKPLLEMAANNQAQQTRTRHNVPQIATTPKVTAQPGSAPAASTPQAVTQPVAPGGVDLSQPSAPIQSPFAPGPDIGAPSSALTGDAAMFAEMKKQVDALVELAKAGVDPVAVANQFFELTMLAIPKEDDYAKLCSVIESENFLSTIGAFNTSVPLYADWFGRVRARLMERIAEADGPSDE